MAKKNSETNKNDGKYYSTKFAPPKKESKEKKLSDNIKKFLQKKEEEERAKQKEQQEKLNTLLSMRDEKSKNKIRKMLKVTKSANRSVLEDAVNTEHTAITMAGIDQPDQDDYGYVSTEANSFFQKYIDKVKDVKEDKGFAPSRPQSLKDLTGTKERVKAAITREIEEKNSHTRTRTPKEHSSSSSSGINVARSYQTSKTLYDPEAEKRAEEEERRKREEEIRKKRKEIQKRPPPPMDFQALLKLAEQKQHQPVEVPIVVPKKKEPERLLTSREKREMEERERAKKAREQRERERNEDPKKSSNKSSSSASSSANSVQRMEPNGRIPKLSQAGSSNSSGSSKVSSSNADRKPIPQDLKKSSSSSSLTNSSKHTSSSSNATSSKSSTHTSSSSSSSSLSSSTKSKPSASSNQASKSSSSGSSSINNNKTNSSVNNKASSVGQKANGAVTSKNPYGSVSKQPYSGPAREFPPRDPKVTKTREFPPPDVQRTRQFPPPDVRRGPGPSKFSDSKKSSAPKRRILDDDDSEYDSELDDFIDDGDEEEDYSSHIKAIFGYDKSKYRDLDEEDDRMMEASFAQIQREEYISKKIGMQEDLEDMKLEAMEKKRKMMKKRRLADD
uniref:Protein SPT2 homolog n=1 Tax=Musca domestica TaxID=7370 RepID=T1PIQ5_MUSDO